MTKHINLMIVSCLLLVSGAVPARAQETGRTPNTAASIERIKTQNLWLSHTGNAAGAYIDDAAYYADADLYFTRTDGTFKRPQSGKMNTGFGFSTDGGGFLGKDKRFYAWGEFNYSRDKIRNAQYNASLIDPFRGTPYYIADKGLSNWINQSFDMKVKAATPLYCDVLYLGFEGSYAVADGAKQKDPRPEIEMSRVEVKPSLLLKMNRHSIGADFDYYSRREYGYARTVNSRVSQTIWVMVAPGFFREMVTGLGSNALTMRDYNANNLGGGLQYGFSDRQVKIVVSGNYAYEVEDAKTAESAESSDERPKLIGTTRQDRWDAQVNARFDNGTGRDSWYLNLSWSRQDMDGIEYLTEFDNNPDIMDYVVTFKNVRSNFKVTDLKGELSFMRNEEGNSYSWTVGAGAAYRKIANIYYLPRSTQDVESLTLEAYARKNFRTGQKSRLLADLHGGASKNLSSKMDYNGYQADNECYKDFTLKDFRYLSTSYLNGGVAVTYSHTGILKNTACYAGAAFDLYRAHGNRSLFNNRSYLTFRLGMAF